MTRFVRLLLLLCAAFSTAAPQKPPANDNIFSGTVAELTTESLTVTRKLPAKPDVTRRFIRDEQTQVEGPLRLAARVTVSYKADDEGQLHALHIIVR